MKVLKWIDEHFEEALISVIICVISVLMMAQIILRTFFNASLSFSDEACRYLFIWAAGLGISYATKKEAHLRMDILPNLFKKLEKPLIVVCDIALIVFAVYLMRPGLNVLSQLAATGQRAASTHVPMYVVYASMWVGLALSIVRIIERYIKLLLRRSSHKEDKEG